jgi:hypothetical protein
MATAAPHACRSGNIRKLRRRWDVELCFDGGRRCQFDLHWLWRWHRRRRHDGLGRRLRRQIRRLRCDLYESQSLTLVRDATRAAVPATTATRRARTTGPLIALDDLVMYRERSDQ